MVKNLTQEDIEKIINSPSAVKLHLYNLKYVLKPRGSMQKNSLGEYMLERLIASFEDWTDPSFGDNPSVEEVLQTICDNFRGECTAALESFFENDVVIKKIEEKNQ